MGYGCTSIAVKHAYFQPDPKDPSWERMVENITHWAELEADAAHPGAWNPPAWYSNQQDAPLGHGWEIKHVSSQWEQCIDYKGIFVSVLRKEDRIVYAINSSQYSNAGGVEMTYFSDDPGHLQDFLNDFFPGETYEDMAAIQQWG